MDDELDALRRIVAQREALDRQRDDEVRRLAATEQHRPEAIWTAAKVGRARYYQILRGPGFRG